MNEHETLKAQVSSLKLHGLLRHWDELTPEQTPWLTQLLNWEISGRKQRSLERRLSSAKLGRFKSLTEFDWQWPTKTDQQAVHRIMQLDLSLILATLTSSAVTAWANRPSPRTSGIKRSCKATQYYLPTPPICLMI